MIATPNNAMQVRRAKLSPSKSPHSQRDFEVYRFVKIEHHSTRQAAGQFNISQSRVRQVLAGIVEYLVDSFPVDEEGKCLQRLQVAEQLAREQLEFLYGQAIEWWQQSVQDWRSGSALPKPSYLGWRQCQRAKHVLAWRFGSSSHTYKALRIRPKLAYSR